MQSTPPSAPRGRLPEIPADFIQQLRERLDVVDIVGRQVELRKAGHDLAGLCPFHKEKSPSFTVSPVKQFYHCFGCGASGDAIKFVQQTQGLGFRDAVEELARQVGMRLPDAPQEDPQAARARALAVRRRALTVSVQDRAAGLYIDALASSPRALEYLRGRKLPLEELRSRYIIGYAPAGWDALRAAFPDYDTNPALVASGLVIANEDGEQRRHDRFRDRVMFGIRNLKGEVVGFGGRLLGDGKPKYLNSPESPSFDKSREMYGLFEARQAIQAAGVAIVNEGYMDVLALAGCGIENAVATMGTACTAEQLRLLLRLAPAVVFCFDGDEAGRRAAWRVLKEALPLASDANEFRFLVMPPEAGKDPDDVVKAGGRAAFEALLAAARPMSKYLLDTLSERHNQLASLEDRARFTSEADALLALMPPSRFGALLRQQLHGVAGQRPGAASSTVLPRAAQATRPAALSQLTSQAARSIDALARAAREQPATAQTHAAVLIERLDPAGQQAFFAGDITALPFFERPMWQALHEVCQLAQPQDSAGDGAAVQRDLLRAGVQALDRARAQFQRELLVSALRQGAVEPADFARVALRSSSGEAERQLGPQAPGAQG